MKPVVSEDKRQRFLVNRVDTEELCSAIETSNARTSNSPPSPEVEERCGSSVSPHSEMDMDSLASPSTHMGTHSTFRSLRQMTREALPRLDHYRNLASIMRAPAVGQRPTLDDLHQPPSGKVLVQAAHDGHDQTEAVEGKFGWVQGVLVRCLLNIWGVILFLRLSWVTGQAGVLEGMLIVTCGNIVTSISALSMSAISTNGQIKGGGTYYMISRSLGPEFGGAIGLIFSLANAVAASMYIVGFCESINDLLRSLGTQIFDGGVNDVRLVGSITLVVLFGICIIGMEWEARAQVVLLLVLVVAILDFVIGAFVGPLTDEEIAQGFVGLNGSVLKENLYSDYRTGSTGGEGNGQQNGFFTIFSVFFPACTGILAGANISGDLKDPSESIPKGTLLAVIITYISYILFVLLSGAVAVRDATGNVTQVIDWSFTNCSDAVCQYGLQNSSQVMELVSVFGPLIYAGCFAATLSSALASIVSAPKVFQALCKDKLYPYIEIFGKSYGKKEEPLLGFVLTFFIVLVFTLIARLDSIAPIITNFFLAAYALINFSTFHASLQQIPSWRPTFKYYNKWLSLVGGVFCTAIMFLIQWWTALITVTIIILLYFVVSYRKPEVNWGSSTQAQTYNLALSSVMSLNQIEEHVKTYRPQILVLCGAPSTRPPLMHFAHSITRNMSLLVAGHCMKEQQSQTVRSRFTAEATRWLIKHKIKAFYAFADGPCMALAARTLMCNVGLGKLRPNLVLMGYKTTWQTCPSEELQSYFKTIHFAFGLHLAVGILRVDGGLDYSDLTEFTQEEEDKNFIAQNVGAASAPMPSDASNPEPSNIHTTNFPTSDPRCCTLAPSSSAISFGHYQSENETSTGPYFTKALSIGFLKLTQAVLMGNTSSNITTVSPNEDGNSSFLGVLKMGKKKKEPVFRLSNGEIATPQMVDAMLRFTRKQPKGTIDVWWLYDDGGLTMLIPYILTTRSIWSSCKLRVFCLANKKDDLASEHRRMAELLCKFRIDFSDVVMIPDVMRRPREESVRDFSNLISKFKVLPDSEDKGTEGITESELIALKDKTNRHIRLRELLLEHSREASFIVMTLPIPAKGMVSAPLYMAWLETLTHQMPPFLLIRGNQSSVLTFYS
ncbi:bumetanide-sensitive sodium-(potassium)-chloride cotransporter-like isoform X3 [Panulirus ornatus]|uniref:bumetanide-sensitive sodium-(potassium)-chloride cotransporter-like isoform X3 n=1 Tax=Panulirus ornatus TaxID=150431 RepID=UPI003A8A5DCD